VKKDSPYCYDAQAEKPEEEVNDENKEFEAGKAAR
jgi:hypothetical protein